MHGVDADSVMAYRPENFPFFGGAATEFIVRVSRDYLLVTIATMAIATSVPLWHPMGSASCLANPSMWMSWMLAPKKTETVCHPCPACPSDSSNIADGNGEGCVHVHRGFFGVETDNELSASGND
jgi:hypothetical protein